MQAVFWLSILRMRGWWLLWVLLTRSYLHLLHASIMLEVLVNTSTCRASSAFFPSNAAPLWWRCESIVACLRSGYDAEELLALDVEGRCVVTDHGQFVLFNVYAPALSSAERVKERFAFKLDLFKVSIALRNAVGQICAEQLQLQAHS